MKKELYLAKSDAKKYAEMFAEDIKSARVEESLYAVADDATSFDYIDRDMDNICWSGQLTGFEVIDESEEVIGVFAYWDDEL